MPPKYTVSTALNYFKAEVFPGGSDAKESACNAGDLGRIPEFRRSEGMATHSLFLPGEFHGQRSLAGYSPWGHKKLDTT